MKSILDEIEKGGARCFVLTGDDDVSLAAGREAIHARLEKKYGALTPERFDAASDTAALFVQRMLTPSLFGGMRLFLVRHAQDLSASELAEFAPVLGGGAPDVCCIIEIDESVKDAAAVLKKLGAHPRACLILEFPKPPPWAIADWIVENAPRLVGRRIAKADAEYLADRVGGDLGLLHSELQKIDLHLPEREPITRNAITFVTQAGREMAPYELAAALGRKDLNACLKISDGLFSGAVSLPYVTGALGRHFWSLFRINAYLNANPEVGRLFGTSQARKSPDQTSAAVAIGMAAGILGEGDERKAFPKVIKSGIVDQARLFSPADLARIIALLFEFDCSVKTGRVESAPAAAKAALERLCHRIVRPQGEDADWQAGREGDT